ncbi:MAG: KdsC family phosphatase [bacterium]
MINKIELIAYDFDGVMTNNKVYIDQHGIESVCVNRADGLGVSEIKKLGVKQIIISTEKNSVVQKRADKLGIPCIQSVEDKEKELKCYCSKEKINLKNVVYVGNDINDMKAMESVGWPICPNDAHEIIKKISKFILPKNGGEGVVREVMDFVIRMKGA